MTNALYTLTEEEKIRLSAHEEVIDDGLNTFHKVGMALLDIRDNRLYRGAYRTFEDYCERRWSMTSRRANQLVEAAEITNRISEMGTTVPVNEYQIRPLTPLEPEQQTLVWQVVEKTAPNGKVTNDHVKSVVKVMQDVMTTGAIDNGEGEDIPIEQASVDHLKAAMVEEAYERMKRQELHIEEKMGRQKPKTNRAADEYVPQGFDACQTPPHALDPLLPYIPSDWTIWEPASGEGLLVEALYDSGISTVLKSDILTGQNFFEYAPDSEWHCQITNPPYSIKYKWIERCYELQKPFALLLPVETLGAKTAQFFFREHGVEVIFIDQRINFKMPIKGWDGNGAQFPVAWFTWGLNIGKQMTFARINGEL